MDAEREQGIARIAAQFGVPPAIMGALADHPGGLDVPPSVAKAYGFEGVDDPQVRVALAARVLSDAFQKHNDWESALSVYRGHEPHNWQTHDHVGGFVDAVLGVAATRQHTPGDPAFQRSQQRLSAHGGVVEAPKRPTGPKPNEKDENPHEIAAFAQQAKGLGLDPHMIAQGFPHAAVLRQRLLGQPTALEDFAQVHGMDPGAMLDYYRNQPHSIYPELTTGQFHDMSLKASLYSFNHQQRSPHDSEVARLAALNAGPKELEQHFAVASKAAPVQVQASQGKGAMNAEA